jgi:uncharacterized protein (TIGR03435 family)
MIQCVQVKQVIISMLLAFIAASSANAQNAPDKQRAFEVASIKLSDPNSQEYGIGTAPGGRFMAKNWTLTKLIAYAYRVQGDQISGGPSWVSTDKFDITAKAEEGTIPEDGRLANPNELPPIRYLVQTFLAERFNLKLHRDMRELPVFDLVIAKNGPKLQKADTEASGAPEISRRHIYAKNITVKALGAALALVLGRAVMDKTGLDGTFQIHLEWSGNLTDSLDPAALSPEGGPSYSLRLRSSLGFVLNRRKLLLTY